MRGFSRGSVSCDLGDLRVGTALIDSGGAGDASQSREDMARVRLFYNSAWRRVLFYSDEQESLLGGEQRWVFREMGPVEGALDWHTIEFETKR